MYLYSAYGLGIHSALPLPELVAASEVEPQVTIRLGKVSPPRSETTPTDSGFHVTAREVFFFWDQVGAFLVRDGKEIIVDPCAEVEAQIIRLPLLGVVLAGLLYQRGALVVHGSAISMDGAAVAFFGAKRSGKSTLAAALYARGHQLVADDVVALDVGESRSPLILPAFSQIKLWPEAVAASLGEDPKTLPRLHSRSRKRVLQVNSRFAHRPVPLKHIYVLDRGSAPEIEPLQPREAMIQLIANSYAARFGQSLLQSRGVSHFLQCAALAKAVPSYRLKRPPSLSSLCATARLVEEYLTNNVVNPEHTLQNPGGQRAP